MGERVKPRKKTGRRRKRAALVHRHLERVSRSLFEDHFDIVRKFIGRNSGVYALYRKNRLYYVGLATRLSGRLKAHIRDAHRNAWDRFSIYLTINDQHLKELEALLLRISNPPGNKQSGKLAGSKDMRRPLRRAVRQKLENEVSTLFGHSSEGEEPKIGRRDGDHAGSEELARLLPRGTRLKGTNKGRVFRARVGPNGAVRYEKRTYSSLSLAASAALRRPSNGWWFWQVERGRGHWVRLMEIRRAGTPLY